MKLVLNFHCLCGLVLLIGVPSMAEKAAASASAMNTLTLDALVREVREKNPELKFYEAEIAVAQSGRNMAVRWSNPELSTELGYKGVRDPAGLRDEGVAWAVSVNQTLEWPGRFGLRKAIANREVELAEIGYAQFRAALTARVRALASDIFFAQEKARVAEEVAGRLAALMDVLVQRDPAGLTPLLETRVIEAAALTMQRRASEARIAAETAYLELNQLRGAAMDEKFAVAKEDFTFLPSPSLEALLAAAQTNNFEIRLRAAELAQQGFKVRLAQNEKRPSFTVGPYVGQEDAGGTETTAGIAVSIPLPLWNRGKDQVQIAAARQQQAQVSLLVAQREIERKVVTTARTYEAKLAEMAKWRPDSIQHFQDAAELADRHYRLGAVPVATYVELQEKYLEAVEALFETKKEALLAGQELHLLTGGNDFAPPAEVHHSQP